MLTVIVIAALLVRNETPLELPPIFFSALAEVLAALVLTIKYLPPSLILFTRIYLGVLLAITETLHVAEYAPFPASAVIVTVPSATPVTVPFSTVAMLVSLLVHVTALLVASFGKTVAVSFVVLPTSTESVDLSREIPETAIGFSGTSVLT